MRCSYTRAKYTQRINLYCAVMILGDTNMNLKKSMFGMCQKECDDTAQRQDLANHGGSNSLKCS